MVRRISEPVSYRVHSQTGTPVSNQIALRSMRHSSTGV
jgi:hypothetical protein